MGLGPERLFRIMGGVGKSCDVITIDTTVLPGFFTVTKWQGKNDLNAE